MRKKSAVVEFGKVLKELRLRRGLSRKVLASLVHVDAKHIAALERGSRDPSLVMLFKLATALGVGLSYLIAKMQRRLH